MCVERALAGLVAHIRRTHRLQIGCKPLENRGSKPNRTCLPDNRKARNCGPSGRLGWALRGSWGPTWGPMLPDLTATTEHSPARGCGSSCCQGSSETARHRRGVNASVKHATAGWGPRDDPSVQLARPVRRRESYRPLAFNPDYRCNAKFDSAMGQRYREIYSPDDLNRTDRSRSRPPFPRTRMCKRTTGGIIT